MNLNDDLKSYLSQSSSQSNTSKQPRTDGLLNYFVSEKQRPVSNVGAERKGWFNFSYSPVPTELPTGNNGNGSGGSRLYRYCCSCFPELSHYQRLIGFGMCLILGGIFMFFAMMNVPFLLLRARSFALLFTCGSLLIASSIGFLVGPSTCCSHFFSSTHLGSTTMYVASLVATLHTSFVLKSTLLTVPCIVVQVFALIWMVVRNIPGGQAGIQMLSSSLTFLCRRSISQTLPV